MFTLAEIHLNDDTVKTRNNWHIIFHHYHYSIWVSLIYQTVFYFIATARGDAYFAGLFFILTWPLSRLRQWRAKRPRRGERGKTAFLFVVIVSKFILPTKKEVFLPSSGAKKPPGFLFHFDKVAFTHLQHAGVREGSQRFGQRLPVQFDALLFDHAAAFAFTGHQPGVHQHIQHGLPGFQ